MTKPSPKQTDPESPARITSEHVQDRHLDKSGDRRGWSRLMAYENAHRNGKLVCKDLCGAKDSPETLEQVRLGLRRYEAAKAFDEGWRICNASWPSGSDLNRVRVVGCPGGFVDVQRGTKDFWRQVERHMGVRDWMICRRVCGDNYGIAETVTAISPSYRDSTLARFREALDALQDAMETARRNG